uniref:Uncharacterized protein n=1 Tax=Sphaerodactylus townsendi TaxID=933632 RepID=A0ACB8EWR7_9SAUR
MEFPGGNEKLLWPSSRDNPPLTFLEPRPSTACRATGDERVRDPLPSAGPDLLPCGRFLTWWSRFEGAWVTRDRVGPPASGSPVWSAGKLDIPVGNQPAASWNKEAWTSPEPAEALAMDLDNQMGIRLSTAPTPPVSSEAALHTLAFTSSMQEEKSRKRSGGKSPTAKPMRVTCDAARGMSARCPRWSLGVGRSRSFDSRSRKERKTPNEPQKPVFRLHAFCSSRDLEADRYRGAELECDLWRGLQAENRSEKKEYHTSTSSLTIETTRRSQAVVETVEQDPSPIYSPAVALARGAAQRPAPRCPPAGSREAAPLGMVPAPAHHGGGTSASGPQSAGRTSTSQRSSSPSRCCLPRWRWRPKGAW